MKKIDTPYTDDVQFKQAHLYAALRILQNAEKEEQDAWLTVDDRTKIIVPSHNRKVGVTNPFTSLDHDYVLTIG